MATKAQWKMPDGNGGFYVIHHETAAEMIEYGNTTVKDFLDGLPVMSASTFMKNLMTQSNAEAVRSLLKISKEPFFDETGNRWSNSAGYLSPARSKFGSQSYYDPGTGGLTRRMDLGGSDFTIAGWFFPVTLSTQYFFFGFGSSASDLMSVCKTASTRSDALRVLSLIGGTAESDTYNKDGLTTSPNMDAWNHIELGYKHSSRYLYLFLNGTLLWSGSTTFFTSSRSDVFCIGKQQSAITTALLTGNVDDFLITKRLLHTSNFTPPTSPYTFNSTYDIALLHFE